MADTLSKYILIVDDSLDQRMLLKMLLESNGYKTQYTSNGEEALNLLHSCQMMPEAILLDLNMPVMGGFDFRQRQLVDPLLKNIPVLVMSGEENTTMIRAKTNLDVIKKPFSIGDLMAALARSVQLH
ncbi:MAG: PleD family two-component system response regulator [Pseudobdellovibrionaceae bacterium]